MTAITFHEIIENDYIFIKEVYDHYILHSTSTYYTEPIPVEDLKELILAGHPKYKSFIIRIDGTNCGFCYLSQYKKRQAYDRTAEVSIYLKPGYTGQGTGTAALQQLEKTACQNGIAVLIAIISGDNAGSIRLFEKCGYEQCARFRQVGEKFGNILDVVGYQKIIGLS